MKSLEMRTKKESDIVALPRAVCTALAQRDSVAFYRACKESDFQPQDEEQRQWYADGHMLSGDAGKEAARLRAKQKRQPKIDYARFGAALKKYEPSLDIFRDADLKRIAYRQAGYTHLYGEDGERIPLDDASDARIGGAFVKTCKAYKRWKRSNRLLCVKISAFSCYKTQRPLVCA